jgi:Ni/Co efflux regulator RcnB
MKISNVSRLLCAALAAATFATPVAAGDWDPGNQYDKYGGHERRNGWDRDRYRDGGGYDRGDRWDRRQRNWWRGRPDWAGYAGRRNGYWYAPGRGYYAVAPRWSDHRWRRGEYLPQAYLGYEVDDPYFYGVRQAPRGYAWVYCNGDLVLASLGSGLILDVLLNVY